MRVRPVTLLLLAACLKPYDSSPLGYRCETDADCGEHVCGTQAVCVERTVTPPAPAQLRGAFYTGGYPGLLAMTHHQAPELTPYDSDTAATIDAHVRAFRYAKLQVVAYSWYGDGTASDQSLATAMGRAADAGLEWAPMFEDEGKMDPSVATLRTALATLHAHFGSRPNALRRDGGMVVFVESGLSDDSCEVSARWTQANDVEGAWLAIRTTAQPTAGFATCAAQPAAWYHVDGSQPLSVLGDSAMLMPGRWRGDDVSPILARDLPRFRANVSDWLDAGQPLLWVNHFNAWGEGTAIESAQEWRSDSGFGQYLDVLHELTP